MKPLFTTTSSVDFGPNFLFPWAGSPSLQHVSGSRSSALRRQVRELCSKKPGVYGMLDRHGELIYIGKAKNLRSRLLSYFRPRSRDPKAGRILAHSTAIAWEINHSEFAALHRELELIRRWRPRFNVQGQPDARRPIYVCLGRPPAPHVFLTRQPPKEILAWYGPISNGRRAREAVRRLNDSFALRDCPKAQEMVFADQQELFPLELSPGCLRHEIGTCLGPCAAACTRSDYFSQVRSVRAFLEGKNVRVLNELEKDMQNAAAAKNYEQAAMVRDWLGILTWLHEQLGQMRQLREKGSLIYSLNGWDGTTIWYLIHAGQTVAAIPAPRDEPARRKAAALIEAVYQKQYAGTKEQLLNQRDSILLVASWFRRYPKEHSRLSGPETVFTKTLL